MIFVSYNHNDQDLIDMIARRLEVEFGRDNIFYDGWSIQPGESIIGQMDYGLEKYSTFFFMLSSDSLKSKMVTKEWQAALIRQLHNDDLKFIPVRIDDCKPPAILADQLYIDLYGEGLDSAVAKMKNVVNNENTYNPHEDISNIQYKKEWVSNSSVKITVYATMYSEHSLSIIFIVPGAQFDELSFIKCSENMSSGGSGILEINGKEEEYYKISLMRSLTKETPFYITITTKNEKPIRDILIGQQKGDFFYFIPEEKF